MPEPVVEDGEVELEPVVEDGDELLPLPYVELLPLPVVVSEEVVPDWPLMLPEVPVELPLRLRFDFLEVVEVVLLLF